MAAHAGQTDVRITAKADSEAEGQVVLDPNLWDATETLGSQSVSRDGSYMAYGVAHGGDENPVVRVMNVATGEHLDDTLRGWKHRRVSWLHDNSGFFYTANPLEGEVAEEEHFYWYRV